MSNSKNYGREVTSASQLIEKHGLEISELKAGSVKRNVSFDLVSMALDAQIIRLVKRCPEIFDDTNGLSAAGVVLSPSALKMYLFAIFLDHMRKSGILVPVAGFVPVQCAGLQVPKPFLMWLSLLTNYTEGNTHGVVQYNMSGVPAASKPTLTASAYTETDLSLSLYNIGMYSLNVTYKEYYVHATTGALTYTGVMDTAQEISAKLRDSLIETIDFPAEPLVAGNGSAYARPYSSTSSTSSVVDSQLTCPFSDWNAEYSMLYLDFNVGDTVECISLKALPKIILPIYNDPVTGGGAQDTIGGVTQTWRLVFFMVAENMNWSPGLDMVTNMNWHGTPINTINVTPKKVQLARFHSNVARAFASVAQGKGSGEPVTGRHFFAWMTIHELALAYRIQSFDPRWSVQGDTPASIIGVQIVLAPSAAANLTIHPAIAQSIADLAPVVYGGQIVLPYTPGIYRRSSYAWFRYSPSFAQTSIANGPYCEGAYGLSSASPEIINYTFSDQTVDAAWVTGYGAVSSYLFHPWFSMGALYEDVRSFVMSSVASSRSELLYPIPPTKVGGFSVFLTVLFELGDNLTDQPIEIPTIAGYSEMELMVRGYASKVPIPGDELGISLFECWAYATNPPGSLSYSKYAVTLPQPQNLSLISLGVLAQTSSNDGEFAHSLRKAYESRHSSSRYGITSRGDDLGVCLWDAIKMVAGQVTKAALPAFTVGAGVLCNALLPGSGLICGAGAQFVGDMIVDMSKSATNRHQSKSPSSEAKAFKRDIKGVIRHDTSRNSDVTRAYRPAKARNPLHAPVVRPPPLPPKLPHQRGRKIKRGPPTPPKKRTPPPLPAKRRPSNRDM